MLKSEAIKKFRDGEICLYNDSHYQQEILQELLTTAKPKKIIKKNTIIDDKFFWSAKNADVWLGARNNNSTIPTIVKISDIKEVHDVLLDGRIQMDEQEYYSAGCPLGYEKLTQYKSFNYIWIDGYNSDFPLRKIYRQKKSNS